MDDKTEGAGYRRVSWLVAGGLISFAALMVAAFLVARRPSVPVIGTSPAPHVGAARTEPEEHTTYGRGIDVIVPAPVPELVAALGNHWHLLHDSPGRVTILPAGRQ